MASAIINLLALIFKAIPTLEALVKAAVEQADSSNIAEAISRKAQKDKAVDAAIDRTVDNDCEND